MKAMRAHELVSVGAALMGFACFVVASVCAAADLPEFRLVIEQHQFTPKLLEVPVGKKFRLIVENHDATPEEFESYQLNREKIVAGKSSIVVFIGPLQVGKYEYFGDFNAQSARGYLIAK